MPFLSNGTLTSVVVMRTATLGTGEVQPEQLSAIMADALVLEHVRVFRQLLVVRCGVIAVGIGVAGLVLGRLHSFGYWFSISVFVAAPVCSWVVERRREHQLARRLQQLSDPGYGRGGHSGLVRKS